MAPSAISAIVILTVNVLHGFFGIDVGSEELTTTITTIVTIVAGIVIYARQISNGRSTWLGKRV